VSDDADDGIDEFLLQLETVRPVTRRLIEALMLDSWPNHTVIVDFGIDSQAHYQALYYPVREGDIMPRDLDQALGHGEKLTTLARGAASNPHKDIEFRTSWDVISGRDRPQPPSDGGSRPPSPSEVARDKRPYVPEQNGGPDQAHTTGKTKGR